METESTLRPLRPSTATSTTTRRLTPRAVSRIFNRTILHTHHNATERQPPPAVPLTVIHDTQSVHERGHLNSTRSMIQAKPLFQWVRGDLIGKGSFGRVYLAINVTNGEIMAVKQVEIPKAERNSPRNKKILNSLKFESNTLKELDHPNIVQYLGFEEGPTFMNIFLEYIPGGSIGSCLHNHGRFDQSTTKSFTRQILHGLDYLHSRGIIHRDMKADNVLVERSGICKISDFGISKRLEDIECRAFTGMQGTIFWMAPEILDTPSSGYDKKVDIWSVGCITLEMWTGVRPWHGQEFPSVMMQLAERRSPPLPSDVHLTSLAEDFWRLCFAADPTSRADAAQLQRHPYLELPPGWQFNPRDIERRNTRRKSKAFRHSRHPSFRNLPPVPSIPAKLSRRPLPETRNHGHSHHQSVAGPSMSHKRGPPIVVALPVPPPEPSPPWNDSKSDSSSASKESGMRARRRRGRFVVANPDGDAEARTYVYNPPPLPEVPSTPTARPSTAFSSRQPTLRHMHSQPVFGTDAMVFHNEWATSNNTSYYSDSDSDGNEDDSDSSLWQKAPADLLEQLQKRQSIIESKRRSAWGRPGVDDVYKHIGEYFHNHDIDKPIPRGEEAAYREALDRVKSENKTLRMVAEERARSNPNHRHRRNTKLWGSRTEEVSAGEKPLLIL